MSLNFSGGSNSNDEFSTVFLPLVKAKTASAHNSSLILWDETKSRGSVGESTVSRMAFCSFLTLKFLSHKYYLSKKSSIVQKKYVNDTTIPSRSNHCTVLMCPMRSILPWNRQPLHPSTPILSPSCHQRHSFLPPLLAGGAQQRETPCSAPISHLSSAEPRVALQRGRGCM